jgi:hypothetical protein
MRVASGELVLTAPPRVENGQKPPEVPIDQNVAEGEMMRMGLSPRVPTKYLLP